MLKHNQLKVLVYMYAFLRLDALRSTFEVPRTVAGAVLVVEALASERTGALGQSLGLQPTSEHACMYFLWRQLGDVEFYSPCMNL